MSRQKTPRHITRAAYATAQNVPQVGGGTNNQNSVNSVRNAGLNILNLRSFGQSRTLTLINGRRQVGGGQGTVSVDTNTIPLALIDRVEIVTGGATAVYGAEHDGGWRQQLHLLALGR